MAQIKQLAIIDFIGQKGGNHYYSIALANELSKMQVQVSILSNFYSDLLEVPNVIIKKTFNPKLNKTVLGSIKLTLGVIKSVWFCKRKNIKWVFFHLFDDGLINRAVLLVFKLFGLKIIGVFHDVFHLEQGASKGHLNQIVKTLNSIIVHSEKAKIQIDEVAKGYEKRIFKTQHGNHIMFIDSQTNQGQIETVAPKTLLFFGQIKPSKGLADLIEAMVHLNEYNLVVAGKPWNDEPDKYIKLAQELGVAARCKFYFRYINDNERDYLFKNCHLIVLPYKYVYQSGVLLMSLSYGLPAVVRDINEFRAYTNSECSIFFKNQEELVDLVLQMDSNSHKREMLSANCKSHASKFYSWHSTAQLVSNIISK